MKPLRVAEDILPLGRFKAQASRVLKMVREEHRAVVITQNGSPSAVLVPPEEYDSYLTHRRFIERVRLGLEDSENGRTISDQEFSEAIANRYSK